MKGTDLGIPLVTGGDLHLFFGDSVGYRVIWDFGEDPDAVARVPLARASEDPARLCSELDFYVTPDVPSIAAGVDPSIERDFASAFMAPPPGEPIERYIAQPPPGFPNIPGTFEVPTGAAAIGGRAYLFYAGAVETAPRTRATLSYVAEWSAPGASPPGYQILYTFDHLAEQPLGGHFIQVAPVVRGDTMYYFGTGDYRRSGIYLAREPTAGVTTAGGVDLYDPALSAWSPAASIDPSARAALPPIVETEGVGELSVLWIEAAELFVLLYQRELHDPAGAILDNRILFRAARAPEGPWSEPVTIVDMADAAFRAAHCCGATCDGPAILHCDRAGLYGAYALPTATVTASADARELDIPFLASTWDPYNVVLFRARVTVR